MKEKMFKLKIELLKRGKLSSASEETKIRLCRLSRIINGWEEAHETELEKINEYIKKHPCK